MKNRNYRSTVEGEWEQVLYPDEVTVENPTENDYWGEVTGDTLAELVSQYNIKKELIVNNLEEGESFSFIRANGTLFNDVIKVQFVGYEII